MCWTIFVARKHKANPLNIFGAFATSMTSQRLPIRKCCPICNFGRNLKGAFLRCIILRVMGVLGVGICINRKSTHDFLIRVNTIFCAICRRSSGWNSNVKLQPAPNSAPFWRLEWTQGSKMLPIEMSTPHSCSTSTHTISLSCIVWPQYTTRQTTPASRKNISHFISDSEYANLYQTVT